MYEDLRIIRQALNVAGKPNTLALAKWIMAKAERDMERALGIVAGWPEQFIWSPDEEDAAIMVAFVREGHLDPAEIGQRWLELLGLA